MFFFPPPSLPPPSLRYVKDGRDRALEECDEKVKSLEEQMRSKWAEKKELEEKISALTKQLANAKVRSSVVGITTLCSM